MLGSLCRTEATSLHLTQVHRKCHDLQPHIGVYVECVGSVPWDPFRSACDTALREVEEAGFCP